MHSPATRDPLSAPSNKGRITERLPWEVLESICDHCEEQDEEKITTQASDRHFASHPLPLPDDEASFAAIDMPSPCHGWPEIPLIKHQKNLCTLSMTLVCRSWRLHLVGLKRLWREIAFAADVTVIGVELATFFLSRVADDEIPLHIYAGLPFGDSFDPTIGLLLSKLREKTHRWERFYHWGRLGPYRSYLDLPAPKLQHFSDHKDLCHLYFGQTTQLFSGHTPVLQFLVTSVLGNWQPANLSNLRALDLWDCAPRLSMESLLNALRCAPQLEQINIVSPNPPLDCSPDDVVDLPHLKVLKVRNPDFYTIIKHLVTPNAEIVYLYSSSNRGAASLQVGPAFQTAHPFVGLATMANPPPMFGQPILLSSIDVDTTLRGLRFTITIVTERGILLRVDLEWTGGFGVHARSGYIRASMSALAEMRFLSPSFLRITTCPRMIDYNNPLFHLDAIEYLIVEGEIFMTVLDALSSRPDRPPLFPKLRYLFFPEVELDMKETKEIPKILRFRQNLMIVVGTENLLLIQCLRNVCVIEERTALVPTRGVYPLIYICLKGGSS